jgi:hypothetical protein
LTLATVPSAETVEEVSSCGAGWTKMFVAVMVVPVLPLLPVVPVVPVVPVDGSVPKTATSEPTQTLAKLTELMCGPEKVVLEVTFTVTVSPLNVVRVNVPAAPLVPHVPDAGFPPTLATVPTAAGIVCLSRGAGSTKTLVAVIVVGGSVPITKASLPTHTSAKLADAAWGSSNVVLDVTLTVTVPTSRVLRVKVPVAPAVPHVPEVVLPLTLATLPIAVAGGDAGTTKTLPAVMVEPVVPVFPVVPVLPVVLVKFALVVEPVVPVLPLLPVVV